MDRLPNVKEMVDVSDINNVLIWLTSLSGSIISGEITPTHISTEGSLCNDAVYHSFCIRSNKPVNAQPPKSKFDEFAEAYGIKPTPKQGCGTYYAMIEGESDET
jgi:hypothetical protein